MLALIGVAPFAIFMSELVILKAAADSRHYIAIALFLLGAGAVFVGALRHAIDMACGVENAPAGKPAASLADKLIVFLPLGALLVLGVWLPGFFREALKMAAGIITGGGP